MPRLPMLMQPSAASATAAMAAARTQVRASTRKAVQLPQMSARHSLLTPKPAPELPPAMPTELGRLRQRRMQQMRTEAVRSRDAAALQYGALHEAPQEDALVRTWANLHVLCVMTTHMPP
jgi:hypothetical protein